MLHNIDFGLISIGSIVSLNISFSRFGAIISIGGVLSSTAISLITCKIISGNGNIGGTWFKWFSNLCNVCVSAAGLSHFLDYFDGKKSQDYIHFMPTTTMPHLMPITVILVLSLMFALGLEESRLLNILLSALFLLTFVIFFMTGFGNIQYKLQFPQLQEDFMSLVLPSTLLILPYYDESSFLKQNPLKAVILSCLIYLAIILILAGLSRVQCNLYGLLCPMSKILQWYEPVEVMLISCTLALAAYRLYVPTLKTILNSGGRYFTIICQESKITGTPLYAVFIIGSVCSLLVYLFSSYQLLMVGSSAFVVSNSLNIVFEINSNYQPVLTQKLIGYISTSSNKYEKLNTVETYSGSCDLTCEDEEAFSDDSGHSSETDIDAEVADYKEKVKILSPFRQDNPQPTLQTGCLVSVLLIFIAFLSFLASQALQNNQMITAALLILGIICWSFIIFYQPSKQTDNNNKATFLFSMSLLVSNVILLGSVNSGIWLILLLWTILGIILWLQNRYGNLLLQKSRTKMQYFFKDVPLPLISTECHLVQTTVSLNQEEKLELVDSN